MKWKKCCPSWNRDSNENNSIYSLSPFLCMLSSIRWQLKYWTSQRKIMATTLTTKNVFQGLDFSRHQSFTARSINYRKKVSQQREKEEEKILKKRLRKWMKGKSLEGMYDTDEVVKNVDPVDFFLPHMIEHRPFIRLAIFLLSCPVQSSSCERLFKYFSFFHTKARNRLIDPISHASMA